MSGANSHDGVERQIVAGVGRDQKINAARQQIAAQVKILAEIVNRYEEPSTAWTRLRALEEAWAELFLQINMIELTK